MAVKKQDWFGTNGTLGKYDNFGAEIEAQPLSDGYAEYGLLFRTSDDVNSFYLLAITTDGGYFMDKRIAGNWTDVQPVKVTPAPSVRPGKNKNLIGVIAQGNTFALYINRVLVNTVTDDSLPGSGLVGVYVYNGTNSANAIVAFSRLTILTPDQARAEWGGIAPAPSSSSQPTIAPPTATATSAPPGLYVTAMGMDQAQPAHGQNVNFTVSFLNTGSGDQSVKWKVYIFRADTPAKSNTESAAVTATFHPGPTMDQPVPMNFKLGSTGNDCDYFFARVDTLDVNNKPTDLTTTDGKVFEKGFSVCK